jgi:pseudouridine synthase
MRINVYISSKGICSRREADRLIQAGEVTINDRLAGIGDDVSSADTIKVHGAEIPKSVQPVYILFHKPWGIETTTDRAKPDNIIDYLNYPERIFPVGRLDKESSGLILLTNDGQIVNRILRQENNHEKEYQVRVDKPIDTQFLEQMQQGVDIYNPVRHHRETTKPCRAWKIGPKQFRIILIQGLNLQIRRMTKALGYRVIELERTRIMHLDGVNLTAGKWRYLTDTETEILFQSLSSK